jgi:hypothetical protein
MAVFFYYPTTSHLLLYMLAILQNSKSVLFVFSCYCYDRYWYTYLPVILSDKTVDSDRDFGHMPIYNCRMLTNNSVGHMKNDNVEHDYIALSGAIRLIGFFFSLSCSSPPIQLDMFDFTNKLCAHYRACGHVCCVQSWILRVIKKKERKR